MQQVQSRAGDLVEHVLKVGPVETPVEVDGERLQPLEAPRQPIAAFRRDALPVVEPCLVHGQRREPADRARQLDLVVAQVPWFPVVQFDQSDDPVADAQGDTELRMMAELVEKFALGFVEPGVGERRDEHRPAAADRQGAGCEVVQRHLMTGPHVVIELEIVEADKDPQHAGVLIHLVHVARVHAEGVDEPRDNGLEHLGQVEALGEVETGVAHQLEIAARRRARA